MPKSVTILLIFCMVFLSGPAALVQSAAQPASLENGCTDPETCQKIYLPLLGITSSFQPGQGKKACLMIDGSANDHGFNEMAAKGVQDASAKLGVQGLMHENTLQSEYPTVIDGFVTDQCDLILTVGFMMADVTLSAAGQYPAQNFAIVDFDYDPPLSNVRGIVFAIDQPSFLAGYLAAGMTKTGKVGVYGGLQIPPVTAFMDGYYYGVQYYNFMKNRNVEVLGWDPVTQKGLFTGNFDSIDDGKKFATTLMDEGVDIILPVAGVVGLGTAEVVQTRGNAWVIGVDTDWVLTAPQYSNVILTSILKKVDAPVYHAIEDVVFGRFTGGTYAGTLANGGVDLGTITGAVPVALMSELEQAKAAIIAGKFPTDRPPQPGKKACLVTDVYGASDNSFNAMTWQGLVDAQARFGTESFILNSAQETDYATNINNFISQGCDLILTVGFLMGDATRTAAEANPLQKFAIGDWNYDPAIPNTRGMVFAVDQSSFLAGFMAAGMTKTNKVGVFGGLQIPPVTTFMDGFYYGVQYYNQQKSASVQVIGWNPATQTGYFTGDFLNPDTGKAMGVTLLNQGADILFPVAGLAGLGAAAAAQADGSAWVIGVDTDWAVSAPEYSDVVLTSVLKRLDRTAYHAIGDVAYNQFAGGMYLGTLANGGTGLGTISPLVSFALKSEVDLVKAGIIAGTIPVHP